MRFFRGLLIAVAVSLAVWAGPAACVWSQQPGQTERIEEDEAGWDCRTMGNKMCGGVSR